MLQQTLLDMKVLLLFLTAASGCFAYGTASAQRPDLYQCEGCEALHEYVGELSWKASIAGNDEPGERMTLTGTVYQLDGETPAGNVIVYAYHTNAEGVYPKKGNEKNWEQRHGYLRGWVETDGNGRYLFDTIRPGSYPSRQTPAHIHMTVKEPDRTEYWIEEVVFEDDPLLEPVDRSKKNPRGGPGIIELERTEDGTWKAVRDIVLERHPE